MVYYGIITDIINKSIYVCNHLTNTLDTHHRARNRLIYFLQAIEKKVESFLNSLNKTSICKHSLCKHRYNCLVYPIIVNMNELALELFIKLIIFILQGFIQRFIVGFFIQATVKCFGSLGKLVKNPKFLFKILKNPVNKQLGLFLGSYVLIFRVSLLEFILRFNFIILILHKAVSCLFRWITNRDNKFSGLIAGFLSGLSMMFYKSASISLYLNFKLLEVSY